MSLLTAWLTLLAISFFTEVTFFSILLSSLFFPLSFSLLPVLCLSLCLSGSVAFMVFSFSNDPALEIIELGFSSDNLLLSFKGEFFTLEPLGFSGESFDGSVDKF